MNVLFSEDRYIDESIYILLKQHTYIDYNIENNKESSKPSINSY